jgi:hypothetical protein
MKCHAFDCTPDNFGKFSAVSGQLGSFSLDWAMAVQSITLEWVEVGPSAFGLVHDRRLVALVYWRGPDAAELAGLKSEPVVVEAGFSWVPADAPWDHFYLFEAPEPCPRDWERARREAAGAYLALARV